MLIYRARTRERERGRGREKINSRARACSAARCLSEFINDLEQGVSFTSERNHFTGEILNSIERNFVEGNLDIFEKVTRRDLANIEFSLSFPFQALFPLHIFIKHGFEIFFHGTTGNCCRGINRLGNFQGNAILETLYAFLKIILFSFPLSQSQSKCLRCGLKTEEKEFVGRDSGFLFPFRCIIIWHRLETIFQSQRSRLSSFFSIENFHTIPFHFRFCSE